MKTTFLVLSFALCTGAGAGEVYLDTVRATTSGYSDTVVSTERAYRNQGAYFAAQGGLSTMGSVTFRDGLRGATLEDDTGFALGARVGYWFRLPFPIRPSVEFEFNYLQDDLALRGRANEIDRQGRFTGSGDLRSYIGMVNFVLALDLEPYRDQLGDFLVALHPYAGIGAGAAYTTLDEMNVRLVNGEQEERIDVGGEKFDFAYQFIGGLEVDLSDEFSIYGEYKHVVLEGTPSGLISDYQRDLWMLGFKVTY